MRLVHLSDIHLSKDNYHEFRHNYKKALISDLQENHAIKPIDLIILTGDLIDKGGYSLAELDENSDPTNPYKLFEESVITPISLALKIPLKRFLFIPGNHDVDERVTSWYEECEMYKKMDDTNILRYHNENKSIFRHNKKIETFKKFEQAFHNNTEGYNFSYNHSTYVHQYDGHKVGFLLVNDSWRCKSTRLHGEDGKIYFGTQQLDEGIEYLDQLNTELNICLFHHALENFKEQQRVERILNIQNIEFFMYGHFHNAKTQILFTPSGTCLGFRGRASLNRPEEKASEYQSGYQIFDVDLVGYKISQIIYRKYIYSQGRFDFDVDTAPAGIDKGPHRQGYVLDRKGRVTTSRKLDITDFIN